MQHALAAHLRHPVQLNSARIDQTQPSAGSNFYENLACRAFYKATRRCRHVDDNTAALVFSQRQDYLQLDGIMQAKYTNYFIKMQNANSQQCVLHITHTPRARFSKISSRTKMSTADCERSLQ